MVGKHLSLSHGRCCRQPSRWLAKSGRRREQIEAEVAAYVEAFNAKDAADLAQHGPKAAPMFGRATALASLDATPFKKNLRPCSPSSPKPSRGQGRTIRFVTSDVALKKGPPK